MYKISHPKIIAAIVFVLIGSSIIYAGLNSFYHTNKPKIKNPSNTSTEPMTTSSQKAFEIDTSSWKNYHNQSYGFKLKYPSLWYIYYETASFNNANQEVKLIGLKDVPLDSGYPVIGEISISLDPELITEKMVAKNTNSSKIQSMKVQKLTVHDLDIMEITMMVSGQSEGPSYNFEEVFLIPFHRINLNTLVIEGFGWNNTKDELDSILESMVNSLEITP